VPSLREPREFLATIGVASRPEVGSHGGAERLLSPKPSRMRATLVVCGIHHGVFRVLLGCASERESEAYVVLVGKNESRPSEVRGDDWSASFAAHFIAVRELIEWIVFASVPEHSGPDGALSE